MYIKNKGKPDGRLQALNEAASSQSMLCLLSIGKLSHVCFSPPPEQEQSVVILRATDSATPTEVGSNGFGLGVGGGGMGDGSEEMTYGSAPPAPPTLVHNLPTTGSAPTVQLCFAQRNKEK